MRLIISGVLFFLPFSFIHAQSLIVGNIQNEEDGTPLINVVVQNITTSNQNEISDSKGQYRIIARSGDSIRFNLLGFTPRILVFNGENKYWFENIKLQSQHLILDTVVIRMGLTKYQLDSVERRSTYARAVDYRPAKVHYSLKNPTVLQAPISGLVEKRTKKYKRLKSFQKMFQEGEAQTFIDSRYSPDLVAALTSLSGDSLYLFIRAYPMDYSFARAATELEIKMWIKFNYREWVQKKP
jgi:hypothetical protein